MFSSYASNLVSGNTNGTYDCFRKFIPDSLPPCTDTISLAGPSTVQAGERATFSWADAPPRAPWTLYASSELRGSSINGHPFDIGPRFKEVGTGANHADGTCSWRSPGIPPRLGGQRIYLEVGSIRFGQVFDSNAWTLDIL